MSIVFDTIYQTVMTDTNVFANVISLTSLVLAGLSYRYAKHSARSAAHQVNQATKQNNLNFMQSQIEIYKKLQFLGVDIGSDELDDFKFDKIWEYQVNIGLAEFYFSKTAVNQLIEITKKMYSILDVVKQVSDFNKKYQEKEYEEGYDLFRKNKEEVQEMIIEINQKLRNEIKATKDS